MASKATASATHSGRALVSRWRTSPSPGASSSTSPTSASAATICSVRRASRLGANSSGIVTPAARIGSPMALKLAPEQLRFELEQRRQERLREGRERLDDVEQHG